MSGYDAWLSRPYENDDPDGRDEEFVAHCRWCNGVLEDVPGGFIEFGGWLWCPDHGKEMQRLDAAPDGFNETRR